MRVAFALWPAPAHLFPLVPMAWALRAAGHEVTFVSHPCIGDAVSSSGHQFKPFCTEEELPPPKGPTGAWPQAREAVLRISDALNVPDDRLNEWNTIVHAFLPSIWDFSPYGASPDERLPAIDGMVSFFRDWRPDLVIWDPCLPGAAVAARAAGAAQARQSGTDYNGWFLDTFNELISRPNAPDVPNPLAETIRPSAERYGVPIDHDTLYGQWTIDMMPSRMNFPVNTRRIPVRWIPYTAQSAMPDWLYPVPDRPRIALSLGLSVRTFVKADWSYLATIFKALADLDVEVVATLDDTQVAAAGSVPDNVRIIDYVPLDHLMPTCSALIHHGGLGTMGPAGHAGVPQLIVDFPEALGSDDDEEPPSEEITFPRYKLAPVTGAYVTSFGAGEIVDMSRPDVDVIRDQIERVLTDPSFAAGAARLRMDLTASPSPSDIVPTLERLALQR